MTTNYEFLPDPTSPAYGRSTYGLKIAAQDRENNDPKVLVKLRRASEWAHHQAIEPGSISGLPGIRALRLWTACGEDLKCLPISTARETGELTSVFLASGLESGRLVVSSCVGYDISRSYQLPKELWRPRDESPVADDALVYDFKVSTHLGDVGQIVPKHLRRLERYGIDPAIEADPQKIDLPLAVLLESVPESIY